MKMRILALAMASILLLGSIGIPVVAGAEDTTLPAVPQETETEVAETTQEPANNATEDYAQTFPGTEGADETDIIVVTAVPTIWDVTLAQMENGTVTADKASAAAGETIILTVTPSEGYVLEILTVLNGETSVEVNDSTFIMPDAAVTVTATFKLKAEATAEDDPVADESGDASVMADSVSVEKPEFVSGSDSVLVGETYTFSYTDTTNYTYSDLTVTVGGTEVTPAEADGIYTIENVTDIIVITATLIPNSYDVTKPACVEGPDKAVYGSDYVFMVTPGEEDLAIDGLKIVKEDGTEIGYSLKDDGKYVIGGTDISGAFAITVTEQAEMTTVTFLGVEESEIEGGLLQTAEIGKAFSFQLIKVEGCDYMVKVGESIPEEKDGSFTIASELVVKEGVTVNIEKVDRNAPRVDVHEYINLNGKLMFLVTAKWGDSLLAYGEETMFYSEKYTVTGEDEAGAYCWLIVSTDEMNTVDQVKAAAECAIVEAAEDTQVTSVQYDCDVNGTAKVDVNDAQLVYDMYNASYMEFTENLHMLKFLEADLDGSLNLGTQDVAVITNHILHQNVYLPNIAQ